MSFQMPKVELGDVVIWHLDADTASDPMPAIVTRVGQMGISVSVFGVGTYNLGPRDGVPHAEDPRVAEGHCDRHAGCWQHRSDWRKQQQALQKAEQQAAAQKQEAALAS